MIRTISQTLPVSALIEQATQDIPGWSPQDQLLSLFTLAFGSTHLEGDILELGSWCGRSAVALGLAAKLSGKGTVHCVDLFPEKNDWYQNADGTYSFAVALDGRKYGAYGEQTVWAAPYLRDIAPVYERYAGTLEAFNAAISGCDLTDWVKPFKGDLHKFASQCAAGNVGTVGIYRRRPQLFRSGRRYPADRAIFTARRVDLLRRCFLQLRWRQRSDPKTHHRERALSVLPANHAQIIRCPAARILKRRNYSAAPSFPPARE